MNYIECFNRSRAANYLQSVFFSSWCLHVGMDGVLRPVCHLRPSWCLDAGTDGVLRRVPFAPVLVPRCWQGWSITPVCHLRPSWCLDAGTDGILRPVPFAPVLVPPCWHGCNITPRAICARPGANMEARMEYYAPCHLRPSWCLHVGTDGVLHHVPFAPVLVPPCWHGWSITPRAICARPGASMLARYTHYSISQILEFLPWRPLLAAHYRLYRASQILGNCKQM